MFPSWSPADNAAMQQIAQLQLLIQDLQARLLFAQSQRWPQQQEIQRLQDELQRRDDQIKHLQEQLKEATADVKTMRKEFDLLKAQIFKLKNAVDVRSPPQRSPQTFHRQPNQNRLQHLEVAQQQKNRKPSAQVNDDHPKYKARQNSQQQPDQERSKPEQQSDRIYSQYKTSYSEHQQPGQQCSQQAGKASDRGCNNNAVFNSTYQQPPNHHRAQQSDRQSARGYGTRDMPSSNVQHQKDKQLSQKISQHSARDYGHDRNTSYSNLNTLIVPSEPASTQSSTRGYTENKSSSSILQQQKMLSSVRGYSNSNALNSIRPDSALPSRPLHAQSSARSQGRDTGSGRYPYDSAMPPDYNKHDPSNHIYQRSIVPYKYTIASTRASTNTSLALARPKTVDPKHQPPKLSSKRNIGRLRRGNRFSISCCEEEIRRVSFDTDTRAVTGSRTDIDSEGPIRESEDDPFVDSPPNRVVGYGEEPRSISLSPVSLPPGMMSFDDAMQIIEPDEKKKKKKRKTEDTMAKYETRDDRLATTAAEIDRICQMIARWSSSFCSRNGDIDLQLQGVTTTDVSRLALILESLAPLPPNEAKVYSVELLKSNCTSQLLATIVWRFLQQRMMEPDILTGLLPNTFEKVVLNQQQLMQTRDTDTSPEERARMIRERSDGVNDILQHREFVAFRVSKVKEVITELRPIVKPFFGANNVRTAAAFELNDIGMKMFNLLINTLTESGVFVMKWTNIRQGYVPSAMRAPFNREPPSALWGKRVQLSIFPSITFRDDSAGNIYTKMTNSAVVVLSKGDLPDVSAAK